MHLGYGCPCFVSNDGKGVGWDVRLQLGDLPFAPGTSRRVGLVFLTPEGARAIAQAGRFYLWEGKFIGEATVSTDVH